MSFVSHLECALCGNHFEAGRIHNLCPACSKPLWVKYDLEAVAGKFSKELILRRRPTLWRYRELLPLPDACQPVSLGETMTPLLEAPRLARELGLKNLWVKDESRLPTGSFKARGMAMAISMAHTFGVKQVVVPTAGNAGGAMAAYAARAGMEAFVFMPADTPLVNQLECQVGGAHTWLVNGLIDDCGRLAAEGEKAKGWFNVSTLKEPYRIEGKKTMGLELAEQSNWELPDVIFYPTGGGTGLIGMWKAFQELKALGFLMSPKMPRMIACQSDGCAPIVRAFEQGARFAEKFENAHTRAAGLRVPAAVGDFMILDAVRESSGRAIAIPESEIPAWTVLGNSREGISLCPESAVCLGALKAMLETGEVSPDERVVIFNTGAAQKYTETVPLDLPTLDLSQPVDWSAMP